jgi:hypothetical protein
VRGWNAGTDKVMGAKYTHEILQNITSKITCLYIGPWWHDSLASALTQ